MQNNLDIFLKELKKNSDNLAIALYGSHAKGTARPDSDIDLLIITKNTNTRSVITKHNQNFEIIYSTAAENETQNKNDPSKFIRFWEHAKILFDPKSILLKFQEESHSLAKQKRHPISEDNLKFTIFNLNDQLNYIVFQIEKNPANATFMLHSLLYQTLEFYFDYHQLWKPAPKETLVTLDKIDPAFAQKARAILLANSINEKAIIFEDMASHFKLINE